MVGFGPSDKVDKLDVDLEKDIEEMKKKSNEKEVV